MEEPKNFSDAPVDFARLKEFTDGTRENLQELVHLYIDQTEIYLTDLKKAVNAGHADQARRLAHSAAGSSATCGMAHLAALLRKIEQAAMGVRMDEALEALPHALAEYDRVKAGLLKQIKQ